MVPKGEGCTVSMSRLCGECRACSMDGGEWEMGDRDKTGPPFYLPPCFLSGTMTCSPRGREGGGQGPPDSFSSSHWIPAMSLAQGKGRMSKDPPPGQRGHRGKCRRGKCQRS